MILVTSGEYFSAKFFIAKIANELYTKKKYDSSDNELQFEGGTKTKKKRRKNYEEDKKGSKTKVPMINL